MEIFFYLSGTVFFLSALAFAYYTFKNARLMRGPLGHRLMAVGGVLFIVATIVGAVDHFFFPGSGLVYAEFFLWIAGLSAIVGGGVLRAKEIQRVHRVPLFQILKMLPNSKFYLIGIATLVLISLPVSTLSALSPIGPKPRWFDTGNMILWAFAFVIMALAERKFHLAAWPSGDISGVEKEEETLLREDILALRVYSDFTSRLSTTAIPLIGIGTLRDVLSEFADEHNLLKGCEMTAEGTLMVERAAENLTRISEKEGTPKVFDGFSSLISRFIDLYSAVASPELAQEMVARSYQATKERYGDIPILLRVLEAMPKGFLEEEKIALLSKEELEAKVKGRTRELEEALMKAREATEALQVSRTSFHNIVERSTDGIIVVDQKGVVRFVNSAAKSLLGRKAEDSIGELLGFPIAVGEVIELDITRRDEEKGVAELRVVETEWEDESAYLALLHDITGRKQAEEETRQRTAQLETLREAELGLAAQVDPDTLLRSIVARAVALLGGTSGGLDLYRPEQDVLEWTAAIGPNLPPTGATLRRGEGLSGKVWESGEPLIVNDYQHWGGQAAVWKGYPLGAAVGVPVRWGEEFLGVLKVLADRPRTFSPADAELLGLFATQAAIAIENAHLFEQERKQRELTEALEEAAAIVSSTLDLEQVLDRILEQVERVVAGDAFSVILIEDEGARLARWRGYELPGEKTQPSRFEIPITKYPNLVKMARTGEPVAVLDTSVDPNWVPAARDQGWRRSYVGAPIQVGGVTVGFLNVSGTRPGQFGSADARRLKAFASHAATAIENARLFLAEHEQRELAEALAEAAAAVGSTLDLDQVLATVLEEVRRLLNVVACSVWLNDPQTDELVCRQAVGPRSKIVRGWRLAPGEGLAGWVARSGESLIVPDTQGEERHFKGVDQQTGLTLRSILSVPLRAKEDVIGVLQVVDTEAERFSPADLRLLEPLATSAAIAIENARLYEQAQQDAKTKAMLLREVNHRVKNNLTAIIGLLYAEQRYAKGKDQSIYQSIMKDLVNRVQGLSTVHSMLSASGWASLQLSELTAKVIRSSLRVLPRDQQVFVDVSPSPVQVTPDQAHNLALVINELATNTAKYALQGRDTGHITVRIACEDDTVRFEFQDDGPGHPEEVLRLERRSVGFDLIQTLVREGLRGELMLHNDHGAVTTIRFGRGQNT